MIDRNAVINRVDPVGKVGRVGRAESGTADAVASKSTAPAPEIAPDRTAILAMAAEITDLGPPFDKARVAALREAIASGNYSVNTAATALALAHAAIEMQ